MMLYSNQIVVYDDYAYDELYVISIGQYSLSVYTALIYNKWAWEW